MSEHYILDDNMNPVAATLEEYCKWNNSDKRIKSIGKATVGDLYISTVFLGIDYNFEDDGEPILFETMVFPDGGFIDERCERYHTFAEAILYIESYCLNW